MIYGDRNLSVIVQNITGRQGTFHTELMNAYAREVGGRGVVAGVAPGKGGREVHGVPVYNTVREALREHDATASVVFVPAAAAGDSVMEAAHAGIELAVVITEHIPVHDAMKAIAYAKLHDCTVIGPNCPGLLSPGECKLGIMPAHLTTRGEVGVVSRSGTLTYEVVDELTRAGIGQRRSWMRSPGSRRIPIRRPSSSSAKWGATSKRKGSGRPASRSSPTSPA